MTMSSLMDLTQGEREPALGYIELFRHAALRLPPGIPESTLMDGCRKNLLLTVRLWTASGPFND